MLQIFLSFNFHLSKINASLFLFLLCFMQLFCNLWCFLSFLFNKLFKLFYLFYFLADTSIFPVFCNLNSLLLYNEMLFYFYFIDAFLWFRKLILRSWIFIYNFVDDSLVNWHWCEFLFKVWRFFVLVLLYVFIFIIFHF